MPQKKNKLKMFDIEQAVSLSQTLNSDSRQRLGDCNADTKNTQKQSEMFFFEGAQE